MKISANDSLLNSLGETKLFYRKSIPKMQTQIKYFNF